MGTSKSEKPSTSLAASPASASPGVKTILSAQPSAASINLSQMSVQASNNNVIDQNGNTDSKDSLATAASAQFRPPIAAHLRFLIALATLVSQGAILIICQSCAVSPSSIVYGFGILLTIFTTFFASEVRILLLVFNKCCDFSVDSNSLLCFDSSEACLLR